MSSSDRRTFVKRSAAAVSAAALTRCAPGREVDAETAGTSLSAGMLRAVGRAVLPSDLDSAAVEGLVADFQAWVAGYEPVLELDHPYGGSDIRYGPPDPAPRWAAQLEALDVEAIKRHGAGFDELGQDDRRALIRRHLSRHPGDEIGAPLGAEHVAVALMSFFYASAEATDLCYGARIAALTCRGLEGVDEKPAPLGEGG